MIDENPQAVRELDGAEIRVRPVAGNALVNDYHRCHPALAPFYAGHPRDRQALLRHADATAKYPRAHLASIRDAVRATTPRAAEKWERVLGGEGFVVTTGQQAGLFGGPAYTFIKILSALRHAERFEAELGVPVVALFWVPGDDHDFGEVDHVSVIDRTNELRTIKLAQSVEEPHSMARVKLDATVTEAVDQFASALADTPEGTRLREIISAAYRPENTVADAYIETVAGVLRDFDLLIVSSADRRLKQAALPVIRRELSKAADHEEAVATQTQRLEAAGYHAQVALSPGAANVMFEDELGRERLMHDDSTWHLRRTRRSYSEAELLARLEAEPTCFSPNVLLRPVVESHLFPTLAYVAGPSEVAYFAQIGCLFRVHGVPMPLVLPRHSARIIEAKVRKVLDKFSLPAEDLGRPFHEVAAQIAREELPASVSEALATTRQHLTDDYAALIDSIGAIDPTLRGPLESARNASYKQLDDGQRKILAHLKKQNEVHLTQLRKAAVNLYPDGVPQERVLSLLPYEARYGEALLRTIYEAIEPVLLSDTPVWGGEPCA